MPSVRLLSLAALGMGAFSSCSAGEIARPGPDRGAEVSAPIATLTIPAPEPTSPALEPVSPEPAPALATVEVTPSSPPSVPELEQTTTIDPAAATDDDDDDEEPVPSSSLRELEPTVEPGRLLVAIGRETFVYERPSFKSQKIGYLRAGAQVRRDAEPAGHDGCKLGFYRVRPEGYVCVGPTATLDPENPVAQFSRVRPDRSAPMPYLYARSLYPTPPFYTRLPSKLEQQQQEVELARHLHVQHAVRLAQRAERSDPAVLARWRPGAHALRLRP